MAKRCLWRFIQQHNVARCDLTLLLLQLLRIPLDCYPFLCRPTPYLQSWLKLSALARRSQAEIIGFRPISDGRRVKWGCAFRTETLVARHAAIGLFDIGLRLTGKKLEMLFWD